MEDGSISDGQLTASSNVNLRRHAIYSRLNNKIYGVDIAGSWRPAYTDAFKWLQVDLLHQTKITGISTQGRSGYSDHVKTFKLSTGNDGKNFASYTESGIVKVSGLKIPALTQRIQKVQIIPMAGYIKHLFMTTICVVKSLLTPMKINHFDKSGCQLSELFSTSTVS